MWTRDDTPDAEDEVKVRKGGGEIVEIRRAEDEGITIDEVNQEWELLSLNNVVDDELDPPLQGKDATGYISVVARLNYMGPDRVDLQFATKESARHMSAPRALHMKALRKIGKYLLGRPRLVSHLKWQPPTSVVAGYTDSDWAGCAKTARSTSGGAIAIGEHMFAGYTCGGNAFRHGSLGGAFWLFAILCLSGGFRQHCTV